MKPHRRFAPAGLRVLAFSAAIAVSAWISPDANAQTPDAGAPAQAAPPARITQAIDEKNLVVLKGNVHPLARPEYDQGAASDGLQLHRMLLLLQRSPDQETALEKLLDDQQDKSSPNYHAWLTPQQFGQQFGPADADIQTVTTWLQSHGFQVTNVTAGRTLIEFSGSAGQVRSAFHTEIHNYLVNGESHTANATDPQIPAALAPVVVGPVSLNSFPRISYAKIVGQFRHAIGKPGLQPLFTFPNPSNGQNFYALAPGDFATIYNSKALIAAGTDGTGQTIAVVGETNIKIQDVQQFRQMFGLPANFDATNVILDGEDPGITSPGEEGEADLDVEWSGATAPGATVKFVVSASTPASAGIDLSALYIVEQNLAGQMSESYGACEQALGAAGNAFYNNLWEQAAAQGITVILSSGDGGSAGCDNFDTEQVATQGSAVSGLASTPFNVSVGGTDFDEVDSWATYWNATNDATGSSARSYIPEIPWNQNCAQISLTGCGATAPSGSVNIIAGSGGPSNVYGKPKWQMGVTGVPIDNRRDQPDVSLFASAGFNGTGYVYCQSDQTISGAATCNINASNGVLDFGVVGGTSVSAPAFAGIMALVNQYQAAHSGTNRQGNANYVLYQLVKNSGASCTSSVTEAASCVFNDVTKGNSILPTGRPGLGTNSVPCQGGSLNCSVISGNGVLVDPAHTSTEAWTVTPGYDMVTGLGTVNVQNLAAAWASASTIQTATTLTLSPTSGITHGTNENVTVGITVKQNTGAGLPTGDVSLVATYSDGTTRAFDHFTLASGAVSGATTQSLPGGTYNVTAHYAGDGTNASSDSPPVQVAVGKEPSQAFIVVPSFDSQGNPVSGNANSVVYGSSYIFRMYVTDKNATANPAGPPSPACYQENLLTCPSGTVTLSDNGSVVDTGGGGPGIYNLNNAGYTRDLKPSLLGGVHSLVANYSGDNSYQASTSAPDTFTVTPAPGTQLIFTNGPTALVGSPVTLNVLGIPGVGSGATATGTVSVFEGSTLVGGPVPVACYYCAPGEPVDFTASVQVTFSTSGNHSLTAQYSGDADYAAATSSVQSVDALYQAGLTQSLSATTITYPQAVTITVTATSGNKSPAMSGQFQFFGSITAIPGPIAGTPGTDANGNQILTATVTTTPQGSELIWANYSGDQNYASVGTAGNFVTVNIPDFSLPSSLTFTITAGQQATTTFNVTPASSTPSQVNLAITQMFIGGATVNLNPSTVSLSGSVVPVTLSVATTAPSGTGSSTAILPAKRAQPISIPAIQIEGNIGPPLAIVVLFVLSGLFASRRKASLAACSALALFIAVLAFGCGGGSGTIGGVGGGGGTGGGGGNAVPTTIMLSSAGPKGPAIAGPITVTATVTSTKTVTGTVNIVAGTGGGPSSGPLTLVNGQASWAVPPDFGVGTVGCSAQYNGDANNLPSQTAAPFYIVFTGSTQFFIQGTTGSLTHATNVTVNLQ